MPQLDGLGIDYKIGQPSRPDWGADRGPGGPPAGVWAKTWMKADPVYRTVPEMVAIKHRLINEFAMRDMLHRFLQRIWDGDFWRVVSEEIRTGGFKYHRYKTDDHYRLTVNYIFATTNNYVDLLSKIPAIHVPALLEADDTAKTIATQNEKILYGIWEASRMSYQFDDLAWYLALLGTAVIESTPDPYDFIPKLLVQHPAMFYPKNRFGRPGELMYGVKRFFLEPDQVADAFGRSWRDNNRYVTMDTATGQWVESNDYTSNTSRVEGWFFYSPWERALFLQDSIVNEFSVQFEEEQEVPWRTLFFIKRPGKSYGMGAAEQTWGLNQYLNQLMSHEANILAYAANPIIVVKNPQQVEEKIPNDPGAVITVGENGAVEWLTYHGGTPEMTQQIERIRKAIEDVSGMPETRYGNTRQNFATGRAIDQLNAPTQDRISSRMRLMAEELQHINRIALQQLERTAKGKTVELFGATQADGAFNMKIKGADVRGYYRNYVTWDEHDHGDAVELLQLLGAGTIDKETFLTKLGFKEPKQILLKVHKDRLADIEVTRLFELAKVVPIAPATEQGLAPGAETRRLLSSAGPEQQQAGMENGATGAPQSPGGPAGAPTTPSMPPGIASGIGGGSPAAAPGPSAQSPAVSAGLAGIQMGSNGPTSPVRRGFGPSANLHLSKPGVTPVAGGIFHMGQVISDFKALPGMKIKGQIWIYGHITEGAAAKIQVYLTAAIDKKTILDNLPPEYNGHLMFRVGPPPPPPGAVEVTPVRGMAPGGLGGGVPPEPESTQRSAPGERTNPTGLIGPVRLDRMATPIYQNIPLPPPGVGPLESPPGR